MTHIYTHIIRTPYSQYPLLMCFNLSEFVQIACTPGTIRDRTKFKAKTLWGVLEILQIYMFGCAMLGCVSLSTYMA